MKVHDLLEKIGETTHFRKKRNVIEQVPVLKDAIRFPYGPFQFKATAAKGARCTILASTDLKNWRPIAEEDASFGLIEYLDSDASNFNHRFYRVMTGNAISVNVIGYAAVTLAPGFSMIANPFDNPHMTVSEIFKEWPEGTTLNRFDARLFRLVENAVRTGKWTNPGERLMPGEGAIFFNPTSDYKAVSFAGDVMHGNLSLPIPSGFSVRSSLVPQPGSLEELGFPLNTGDVIHLYDRDRQKYSLHPFEEGKWTNGPPLISVGESFWVAKTAPGNWVRTLALSA
jgi:hypothetical protein